MSTLQPPRLADALVTRASMAEMTATPGATTPQACGGRRRRGPALRRPWLAAALLALACGGASAASLSEVFKLAQANDAQLAAARQAALAGAERAVQGRAGLLPTVTVSGQSRYNRDRSSSYDLRQTYNSHTASLVLNQPLLRIGNRKAAEQGEMQAELAQLQLQQAEQALRLRVARGFFEVLQAEDAQATLAAQKQAFATQLAQARRSYEVGLAPITDVSEAQARYDLTVAQEIAARNDVLVKRRTLEKSVNGPLPPLDAVDPNAAVALLGEPQLQALRDDAAKTSLQVAAAMRSEAVANLELSKQETGHYPTVDVVATLGKSHNPTYGMFGGVTNYPRSVGVEFNLPLYQGGAVSSRIRESAATLERARAELDEARRQAALDAEQARLGVESGLALAQAMRQAVSSTEQQVTATRRGFEVGVRTRVDVLNAEQQLYTARRDLSAARYQVLVATLQLKAAAGVLNDEDLRQVDRLLKPR